MSSCDYLNGYMLAKQLFVILMIVNDLYLSFIPVHTLETAELMLI